MKKLFVVLAFATVAIPPAVAQAGPVQKQSTSDLVCQLAGDCGTPAASPDQQMDKGATRGFSIYRARPATPVTPPKGAPLPRVPAHAVATETRSHPAPGRSPARPAGRAELMVTFVSGSAALTDSSRDNAMALVGAVNAPQLAGKRFSVEGHTDSVGSHAANLDLSQRRAQAVIDFLVKNGADPSRLEAHGYGPDRPLAGTRSSDGRNRRVEVVVIK